MKRYIIPIVAGILAITSCKDEIPMPKFEQDKQRVAIDAMITTERKAHYVKLTGTVDYASQDDPIPLSNAAVSISDGSVTYKLTETSPGVYVTDDTVQGKVWKTYALHVEVNGQSYDASCKLYPGLMLDSMFFETFTSRFGNNEGDKLKQEKVIYGYQKSTAKSDVFFFMKRMVNGVMQNDSLQSWSYTSEEYSSGTIDRFGRLSRTKLKYGDTVTIFAYSAPKAYTEFYGAIINNMNPPTPFFGGPPANATSNISNDGLGYFLACDVTRLTGVYNRNTDLDSLPEIKKRLGL